jgi:hypothetical protein
MYAIRREGLADLSVWLDSFREKAFSVFREGAEGAEARLI